jgi:hypothetical protein
MLIGNLQEKQVQCVHGRFQYKKIRESQLVKPFARAELVVTSRNSVRHPFIESNVNGAVGGDAP